MRYIARPLPETPQVTQPIQPPIQPPGQPPTQPPIPPLPKAVGYLEVLRDNPSFRWLFLARTISLTGDWFSLIAIFALLREVAGSDARAIGGVLILKLLPFFLAGPIAGVVADRFDRRMILFVADLFRIALVLMLLAVPHVARPVALTNLLILLQVIASAFFEPARAAMLPNLVPRQHLAAANALGAMMWSIVFALGAATGGLVTDWFGWRTALLIDASTYALSAACVLRITLAHVPRPSKGGPLDWMTLTGLRDVVEGVRFLTGRPSIAVLLFLKSGWGLAGAVTLFLTLFGERVYALGGRPDLGVALLYFARAVGTGLGPVLARRFLPDESPRSMKVLLTGAFLWPAFWYSVFALVHDPWLAAASVALAHFGGSVVWVYSSILLQREVPDEFRGRVMSADLGLATLTISLSTAFYGWRAADPSADLRTLMLTMTGMLLVPTAIWWWASGRWRGGESTGDER